MKLAIPSNSPGGLTSGRSAHFGHCDVFTVVSLDASQEIEQVEIIVNRDHQAGGCMVPVKILNDAEVKAVVVGGLGARPMQGFAQVGIDVYFAAADNGGDVQSIVQHFVEGKLPRMQPADLCQGSGNCHH
ncbi:MAG: NifB/NifX family molybdenum-iron cluster-binding protein [Desulfopila sp.]